MSFRRRCHRDNLNLNQSPKPSLHGQQRSKQKHVWMPLAKGSLHRIDLEIPQEVFFNFRFYFLNPEAQSTSTELESSGFGAKISLQAILYVTKFSVNTLF